MSNIALRIPDDLSKSLENLAKMLDRSKSYIIKAALKEYIEERLWEIEESEIACERNNDPNAKFYTSEEAEAILRERCIK